MFGLETSPQANALRGEAPLRIGSVDLVIAVEFGALAKLSRALRTETMDELMRRLLGFEPLTVAQALLCLTVHDDGPEEARKLAASAVKHLTIADQARWRTAIDAALSGHIEKADARPEPEDLLLQAERRVARAAGEIVGDFSQGKPPSPSA